MLLHPPDLINYVDVVDSPPDPLIFYRNWVSQNRPLIIKNAAKDWPALSKWSEQYLRDNVGSVNVTVAVTPNGYADAVYQGKFVMPEERKMSMNSFIDTMNNPGSVNGVFYVQKQNSNLTDEFSCIIKDVEPFSWAETAFGKSPDAKNFWMGDKRAVTSMHKDPYENLYTVIQGQKDFILLPPTDLPYLPYENFQAASYKETKDGTFEVIDEDNISEVPWINIDPLDPDLERCPAYSRTSPFTVTVRAGETLYLPSLWFHHVRQSHACIAVNFWYDMVFDFKWAYFRFLEKLCQKKS